MATSQEERRSRTSSEKSSGKREDRWKWDETKTQQILEVLNDYKRQKLGEGIEWDSDKIAMLEDTRRRLAEEWPNDFGQPSESTPAKPVEQMTKEEYKLYVEEKKKEKEGISQGYKRVANKYKSLKRQFSKDCQEGLRSGQGQLTAKYWADCLELWGGSSCTSALSFGVGSSLGEDDESSVGHESTLSVREASRLVEVIDQDETASVISTQSESASNDSSSDTLGQKRPFKPTAKLVDSKREKLQKKLTQGAKQDILIQNSQKQLEVMESMLQTMAKKDDGLEAAMKSMAESSALLAKSLAMGMQYMMSSTSQPSPSYNMQFGQYSGARGHYQFPSADTGMPFYQNSETHMPSPAMSHLHGFQHDELRQGQSSDAGF